ncbi:hypothetical protein ABL78_6093 [Leptomonas seymouri]|uniref:Uncharacterized protein n=1 Tax=Leptomonas seymouri TaxID=5684 RepID=A0A0N1HU81_LEPSE|nr:hypothetical protein ABL78_6093 [Leptomonas seymouri]|eukprot:KPI84865.1 hypothetical protein ABL78_6093 [Leptomonas seymouri]
MNTYTSDGLLVEQTAGADSQVLPPEQGQQLITIYRLFLQVHHAGNGSMRIKDMLKPDAMDSAGDSSADKTADRRTNATRGAILNSNWSSMPSMPEAASAYSSSIAAVSTGTPYPLFLLSSNAIPETHRLRGFPSGRPPVSTAGVPLKSNNRSCNGCEEIPLRWSLLTKQTPATAGHGRATVEAPLNSGAPAVQDKSEGSPQRGPGDGGNSSPSVTASVQSTTGVAGGDGTRLGAPEGNTRSLASAATATAAAASSAPRAFASGWSAAELQVHTTHRVLVCTATELPQGADDAVEDGSTPLIFCCCVQSSVA